MEIGEAFRYVNSKYSGDVGKFYAPGSSLAVGKGLIYKDSVFAVFDPERSIYRTAEGVAYILTHECDAEPENTRSFNLDLLVCPLMPLELLVAELAADQDREQVISFLSHLGARRIPRLTYLPPIAGHFEHGAVMFLNQITNAPTELIRNRATRICAVTAFGLMEVEYALENHLLRPKADRTTFGS